MTKLDFLIVSLKNFKKTGTITQSSTSLAKKMASFISEDDRVIVELGGGDGAVTRHLLNNMHKDAILLTFEVNENLFDKLTKIEDSRFFPICDGAENLEKHLLIHQKAEVDTVISGLPFIVLPTKLTMEILDVCKKKLKTNGIFVQFHYATKLKKLYKSIFKNIETHFIVLNAPPAFVFKCIKN